jgi:acetyltransferase-like isoleucine patch superfamily enzyme
MLMILISMSILLMFRLGIGMNAIVLPGVVLGPHTVVGAGAVVTKSFEDSYCVVVENLVKKVE